MHLTRLDQFAFETDKRKLHLVQTFALSELVGNEMQQFRETGVLTFATAQALFDREFPGHYLRLVKRVKISVVALVPIVRGSASHTLGLGHLQGRGGARPIHHRHVAA